MSLHFTEWLKEKKLNFEYGHHLNEEELKAFINSSIHLFFPGYFEEVEDIESYYSQNLNELKNNLSSLLKSCFIISKKKMDLDFVVHDFLEGLPELDSLLQLDLEAIFEGDPAANSKEEIIICYPGFYAIFIYRLAHAFYQLQIPILPRLLSEHAHSKTGIDIHPGATIGHHFFIDHGTGIVIGETTVIGNHVKLYQGVTLGALSLKKGHELKGTKRHPTILDHVTIYSEASIFGGDTIIGPNVTIGSNAFITKSIPERIQKDMF
ncbi:MAG: hypothetical protein K2I42_04960 [Anaeroplasmataceae bacterium]|nr:hypothetical protein [Anaeroplasmataceae bacterium]